ncbi:uncharacterized protein TNCV_236751 [Trichonephila clavipes]|nr:uncharacterized protein TNCV_236751 [Trichonephila clavipes]
MKWGRRMDMVDAWSPRGGLDSQVQNTATDFAQLKAALSKAFPAIQNKKELKTRFYASQQRQNQEPTDFVYDLLKLNKKLELGMSDKALVDHIFVRLEPQVQDYVEVRNPQTAIQLLEVLAKFEERYSCKATLGSRNSNNMEGRGWNERRMTNVWQKVDYAFSEISDGIRRNRICSRRLFEDATRNTKTKHEKREKYYNRRRRDVHIKMNDWVLVATHPLSSATRKVVAKFKPKFEGPYRVLDVKNNNVVIWKAGKRIMINVDQVRIYRHRKCDETEIGTGSSDNGNLRDESSGFDRVQRRSNESRDGKKKDFELKRELEEKGLSFRNNQGRHNKEDQFDPEKAEKGTIVHTSKNEQDQATRIPDEELINNGKTRKGEERGQRNPCHWSSQGAVLSLAVCRRSMVIDRVASGEKRLSGGVTSSRRGAGCQS